jgi:hypothetical protein
MDVHARAAVLDKRTTVDDGHRAPAEDSELRAAHNNRGILIQAKTETSRLRFDQAAQASESLPLREMRVDENSLDQPQPRRGHDVSGTVGFVVAASEVHDVRQRNRARGRSGYRSASGPHGMQHFVQRSLPQDATETLLVAAGDENDIRPMEQLQVATGRMLRGGPCLHVQHSGVVHAQ